MDENDILDELDLGGPDLSGLGLRQPKTPLSIEYVRDLTKADLAAMLTAQAQGPTAPPVTLKRIHASHHSLARCLASGMKPAQASLVTGYDNARISVLQADPTFQALVADYRAESKSIFADLAERMNDLSLDAIEILQERLQASPEDFSVPMLLDVVKAFADRTGHGPNQDVNVRVSAGDFIDRPPRETYEDWQRRRSAELAPSEGKPEQAGARASPSEGKVIHLLPPPVGRHE